MVRSYHWTLRYGIAVTAVVCSTFAFLFIPVIGRSGVTIPFFAVFISAWFGGLGPGLFSIVLSLVIYVAVMVQRGSGFPPWVILQIVLFIAGGALLATLVEVLHAARRRAEANGRWLTAVLSSIGDAVIATDGQGRVAFTNLVARSLTGWSEDEAAGQPLEDVFTVVSEQSRRLVENPVTRVIREGRIVGLANHTALIARDGSERPIADSAAPIKDHDNQIIGVVLVFRDVAEARQHEVEREGLLAAEQAARAEAESANHAKDRFLAVLSHELRTPLTPVLIATSSLLEQSHERLDPGVRSVVEMVKRNVELEARLINDLLDVSRIARGRLVLDLDLVDVHRAVRDCVEVCRDEAFVAGLDVDLDLSAGDHHVSGDHARLMQVFWNLIHNAARFTDGSGTLLIRTSNAPGAGDERANGPEPDSPAGAGRLVAEFTDTGVGIDPAIHERIFEPFYQGETGARHRSQGLGLGLAIGRSIAEAHDGRLSLSHSDVGQGATFRLELPAVAVAVQAVVPAEPVQPPSMPAEGAGLIVLLVEDNKDTLRYLTMVLQERNYQVVPVDCVSAARAAAGDVCFDLLISDIELPDGTGHELMHGLGGGQTLPGIAISGFGSDDDLRESARAGFAEHLTKPIDLNRLESAIRRVTSARRAAASIERARGKP